MLTLLVAGLVLGLSLLNRWVRRVDQQAGATLPRRAAHFVRPGWRSVLGVPRTALLAVTYAGATVLTIAALTMRDGVARYAAVILLIGLCGAAIGTALPLRHVLTHPVVADDEGSFGADHLMRVGDAREVALPTVVSSLPVVSVFEAGLARPAVRAAGPPRRRRVRRRHRRRRHRHHRGRPHRPSGAGPGRSGGQLTATDAAGR